MISLTTTVEIIVIQAIPVNLGLVAMVIVMVATTLVVVLAAANARNGHKYVTEAK